MGTNRFSEVFKKANDEYGEGLVHLLITWLKSARILLSADLSLPAEVLSKLQQRAFVKQVTKDFESVAKYLDKDDCVVWSGNAIPSALSAKSIGFNKHTHMDGLILKPLDRNILPYFEAAESEFTGSFNDTLIPTPYLFLDRDGVIIDYVSYPDRPSQVKLRQGIVEVIQHYRQKNYRVVMVTNQSGIARGYSTQEDFRQVQNRTLELLAEQKQWIDASHFATYLTGSDNIQTLQYPSLRKPRIGMLQAEMQFWNVDLKNSVMIGDNASDVEWAQNAAVGKIFWLENPELKEKSPRSLADVVQVKTLHEVLKK